MRAQRDNYKRVAILVTVLMGLLQANVKACDYRVTSALNDYTMNKLKRDVIVSCGYGYNLISNNAKCSYSFGELRVITGPYTNNLSDASKLKVDKCLGVKR